MIQIARPESSNDGLADPRLGLRMASVSTWPARDHHRCVRAIERFVARPARSLPGGGTLRRNRTRMVGETTMNLRNGSTPSPPNGVAKDMGELTHDIVSLAELQFELFRNDCRDRPERTADPRRAAAGRRDCGRRHGADCADPHGGTPRASRRPIAGGGLFDRCAERLHRGGGPGSCGVVPASAESGACLSVPAKN